jgi:hypothetical protein
MKCVNKKKIQRKKRRKTILKTARENTKKGERFNSRHRKLKRMICIKVFFAAYTFFTYSDRP